MIAVDRAQTVLRYWNWALSSALTPALMQAIRDGDESGARRVTRCPSAPPCWRFAADLKR